MDVLPYSTGQWDSDTLGNHRVVLRVGQSAPAVRALIPWRRRDAHPEAKALILTSAQGERIPNLARLRLDRESASLIFEPAAGPGLYYLYFMPYTGSVRSPYPQITYLPPEEPPGPDWLAGLPPQARLPQAEALEIQSITELDSFYPMEVIATRSETRALLAAVADQPFLLFPEDRSFPIRMDTDLPYRWIERGPNQPFHGAAARGEYYTFQVGVFAAAAPLHGLHVEFSSLSLPQSSAPAIDSLTCFNLSGVDWTGRPFRKALQVEEGCVQALWCGLQIPAGAEPGEYRGELSLWAKGSPCQSIPIFIQVLPETIPNYGDDEPARLSRLRWLNSTIALDDEPVAPFTPIEIHTSHLRILGRSLDIGRNGLPVQLQSFFSPEMIGLQPHGRDLLAAPLAFNLFGPDGQVLHLTWAGPAERIYESPGRVQWQSFARAGAVTLSLKAVLEFDGVIEYTLCLRAAAETRLGDARLEIPFRQDVARYMLGLGVRGGLRPPACDWTWDVLHKNQDSFWLGDVNAGLQVTLKDERYTRPLNTNFYTLKPLQTPRSWDNAGKGSIRFAEDPGGILRVICSGGPRTLQTGEMLYFNFRLALTPFKPIDTAAQWSERYYHRFDPPAEIKAAGANVVNVHHATPINPFINYPFLRPAEMKEYSGQAHALGLKAKIYYTVRELTNHAPELFALRSLGGEILARGPGGGHSWLQEHLVSGYVTGWHVYDLKDVAVVNSGASRWHNFYLEGLDWLARNLAIDGLYLDDLAFDRVVMQRLRKILDQRRPGALVDLHSANQFRERDGYASSANLYMEHFPYLNRLWFGEYFEYDRGPDYWLTEVSGIPFGLMGEMLQDGGNPWRGMLYGMTGRLPWAGDPRPLWRAWDAFGIQDTRMLGYWSPRCPVRSDIPTVLATVYQKEGRALIALASWAPDPVEVRLAIDWHALGIQPAAAHLTAPAIEGFQPAASFDPCAPILVEPGKGWLLVLQ